MGHISFWPMLMTLLFGEKTLLEASKEVGLEGNPEKTKYMLMSQCKKAVERHGIKIANKSFEGVAKFKYLGTTLTEHNCKHALRAD
jgi:hypothetical protein